MFFLTKLHPHLQETEKESYNGPWLNRKWKEDIVTRFYKEDKRVPLCIDHKKTTASGYVKPTDSIGEVCDLFIDKDSELIMKFKLYGKHKQGFDEVNSGMFDRGEKWGVSVGLVNGHDEDTGKVHSRNLVHVALTKRPGFGNYDTFITKWGLQDHDMNRYIVKKYGGGNGSELDKLFLSQSLRNKLEAYSRVNRFAAMDTSDMQTENKEEQQTNNNQQEQGQQEEPVPLGLDELRATKKSMEEHAKANPSIWVVDPSFRDGYGALEKEIGVLTEKQTRLVQKLRDEKKLSANHCDSILGMIRGIGTETTDEQSRTVSFACATVELQEEADRRYALLEEENRNLKKEREAEAYNANAKRARSQYTNPSGTTGSSNWSPTLSKLTQSHAVSNNKPSTLSLYNNNNNNNNDERRHVAVVNHDAKIVHSEPLNNPKINNLVDPRFNGYTEPTRNYNMSASQYAIFQQIGAKSNQPGAQNRPTFT